jgi:hypothetical protein
VPDLSLPLPRHVGSLRLFADELLAFDAFTGAVVGVVNAADASAV